MPKPVKKDRPPFKTPPKTKRPLDPSQAAQAALAEHMARMGEEPKADFGTQLSSYMAKLGAKGGRVSGAKRMQMPKKVRTAIARKAAAARWGKATLKS